MASQSETDNYESFGVILFIGVLVLYFFFKDKYWMIAGIWKFIRLIEIAPFYYIPDFIPYYGDLNLDRAFDWIWSQPIKEITRTATQQIDSLYFHWISWVPSFVLIYWGIKRILSGGGYSTRYDMESILIKVEPLYPQLKPFLDVNPVERKILYKRNQKSTHAWAMSISPREYGLMSPPMGLERESKIKKSLKNPIWDGKKGFDFDLCERALSTQLGDRFNGIDNLKDYERALFDIFIKKASIPLETRFTYFSELSSSLLRVKGTKKIAEGSLTNGKRRLLEYIDKDIEQIKKPKKKKKNAPEFSPKAYMQEENIVKIIERDDKDLEFIFKLVFCENVMSMHAFVKTGLMELLERVRDSGVSTHDEIKWVKQVDRGLSYCLSSVGRKVSFVESCGPFAHWLLEKQVGRPVSHPEVGEAVTGLFKALNCHVEEE